MKAPLALAALLVATPIALLAQAPSAPPAPAAPPPPAAHAGPPPGMHWQRGPQQGGASDRFHGGDEGSERPHMRRARFDGGEHGGDRGGMHGEHGGPEGMHHEFWKNPELVARIGLTPEQTKHLDDISLQSRMKLIQMHATLEEQRLMLEPLLSSASFDAAKATAQFDKIADARAAIEKEDARTMIGIRAVLTPEQWTKLHAPRMGMHGGERGGPERGGPDHGGPDGPRRAGPPPTEQAPS
jgi:Spy/CpxP family protein refolding chaperone